MTKSIMIPENVNWATAMVQRELWEGGIKWPASCEDKGQKFVTPISNNCPGCGKIEERRSLCPKCYCCLDCHDETDTFPKCKERKSMSLSAFREDILERSSHGGMILLTREQAEAFADLWEVVSDCSEDLIPEKIPAIRRMLAKSLDKVEESF